MFNLLRGVCLIVLIANLKLTPSSNVKPSAIFALVNDLIVRIVLFSWPSKFFHLSLSLLLALVDRVRSLFRLF